MELKSYELRVDSTEEEKGEFTGYLSVFGVEDTYGDIIDRGAFERTLLEKERFPLLSNHDVNLLLGDFGAREDGQGLFIDGRLILTVQKAREKYELLRAGVRMGLSMGFQTTRIKPGKDVRHVQEVDLWEGSLVTFPSNPLTWVDDVRQKEIEELEERQRRFMEEYHRIHKEARRRLLCR